MQSFIQDLQVQFLSGNPKLIDDLYSAVTKLEDQELKTKFQSQIKKLEEVLNEIHINGDHHVLQDLSMHLAKDAESPEIKNISGFAQALMNLSKACMDDYNLRCGEFQQKEPNAELEAIKKLARQMDDARVLMYKRWSEDQNRKMQSRFRQNIKSLSDFAMIDLTLEIQKYIKKVIAAAVKTDVSPDEEVILKELTADIKKMFDHKVKISMTKQAFNTMFLDKTNTLKHSNNKAVIALVELLESISSHPCKQSRAVSILLQENQLLEAKTHENKEGTWVTVTDIAKANNFFSK